MHRDPEAVLSALLGSLAPGDRLADGSRIVALAADTGFVVELDVEGSMLEVELVARAAARDERVFTEAFALGYRSAPDGPAPVRALAACRAVATAIAPHEASVLRTSGTAEHTGRIRELRGGRMLVPARGGARSFYKLSPYVGCAIGCRFCYAQSRLQPMRALLGLPDVPWGSWIDARVDAAEVLAAELATAAVLPVKFCPIVSDPYQALERRMRLTRACLLALREWPAPVLVLTRATAILDDVEHIAALHSPWVGVSLPTIDDEVRTHFEPRAASVAERLHVLQVMRDAGVRTFAVVQPILPGDVVALADALARSADAVAIDVLHGEESAAPLFADRRYQHARDDAWQRERADELRTSLHARAVAIWDDDLPPEVAR